MEVEEEVQSAVHCPFSVKPAMISHFAHLALLDWRLPTWTLSLIFAEYGHIRQWLFKVLHHPTAVNNYKSHIRLCIVYNVNLDVHLSRLKEGLHTSQSRQPS
jgi:hypothetical protein